MQRVMMVALALLAGTVWAGPAAPALNVVITHEASAVGADGVTRSSRYQERFLRDGGNIWLQRLLPANAPLVETGHAGGHEHPDLGLAGRHITRGADGRGRLALVLAHERRVVDLRPVDYEDVGFDDCWTCAYHFMDPARLARMTRLGGQDGLVRYQQRDAGVLWRITWDERLQIPRLLESRRLDGRQWSRITLAPAAGRPAQPVPWASYRGYVHIDLADLGD